uniref:Uncharacterized protein n=1 Tax=Anguilla anguilla TaxID=7936 RepID=A0A0E9PF20_ANGAN
MILTSELASNPSILQPVDKIVRYFLDESFITTEKYGLRT